MSEPEISKALPITTLILRVFAMLLLLTSVIILATDSATFKALLSSQEVTMRLKYIYSYRYMLSAAVIGIAYTFFQLPFAIYHISTGKRLIKNVAAIYFDFFSDKVILCFLASGVGAGFGATYDLKENLDQLDDIFKKLGSNLLSEFRTQMDDFFTMGYVSATLLLLGFLCFGVSSLLSFLTLFKRAQN
ncbi:hypothetical protein JCGZ_04827 [Jatropha curcas]|uniref:CASP-like protein n=1 Tax=Jatropha curcas TaxID=180498 RepID=A0A067L278_JATCU|nr:CASP-like protein 4D1 [Jatropha curcas]KDP38184.1 hypothetical protein JCGZ_04827 [Jatropha curcas]